PVSGAHHREGGSHAVQPEEAVDLAASHRRLSLQFHAQRAEERLRLLQVVDDDGDVVQARSGAVAGHRAASAAFCCMSSAIEVGSVVSKSINFAQVGFTTIRTMRS